MDVQTFVQWPARSCAVVVADRSFRPLAPVWSCCVPLQKAATDPPPSVSVSAGREDGGEDETSQPSSDSAVHHAVQESESGLKEGLRYLSFTQ